ncbi:NACHT domain-containing protein [Streptomyces asoensis]|uniref:NACHT domain-containing protein n=1 Tax=Streptomyces asoensis TaxID=249586 RepID=UPI00332E96B4
MRQLKKLQTELRRRGRTQKAAVEEANRRRRKAAGRPEGKPWPRGEGGLDLSPQTVNDWFPKQNGSNEPSLARDFEDLWAVVAVILEWTGQLTRQSEDIHRRSWKALHEDAWSGTSLDEDVRAYLEAARESAGKHPYPEIGPQDPPALACVYVRQRSSRAARAGLDTSRGEDHAATTSSVGPAAPAEPAEVVFRRTDRVCVLIAGPGGGKSTLLRTRLREAAGQWLGGTQNAARTGEAVPVWVSARTLTGEETQVPDALAAATRKLSRYGRHPELDRARFLERPRTGTYWQLLVDGLDELPNQAERRAVLEKLAHAVAGNPPLYRCVVATRPLATADLDILDRVLDSPAPRYELRPFTSDDLHTYIEKYFGTRWPQEEAARRAQQFTDALRSASLVELARIPLMAFVLCQLHLAWPERPLPVGRTAVYDAFTDLLYENNHSKQVAASHEEAIENLVQALQSPQARQEADQAARQVHQRLPELIDYLAHQWLTGHQAPVPAVLASHEAVRRPGKVRPERWNAFLEDLLHHTGLLIHHADGLDFRHQTFLEYHAARHATRDQQARTQLLDSLFPPRQEPQASALEPSYLGFLLDALLASPGGIAAETNNRIEALTSQGGTSACDFLIKQVALRTRLPTKPTASQLTRFTQNKALDGFARMRAAECLAGVEGYRNAGADLLIAFTCDTVLDGPTRVSAAAILAEVGGYRDRAVRLFDQLTDDLTLSDYERVWAAECLAGVEGYRAEGARRLMALADNLTLDRSARKQAAQELSGVYGYRDQGNQFLAQIHTELADDPTAEDDDRVRAAECLAGVEGYRNAGADRLIAFANDPTLGINDREQAVWILSRVDGYRDRADQFFAQIVGDRTLAVFYRRRLVSQLAQEDGYQDCAARLFARLCDDPAFGDYNRLQAAEYMAGVNGYEELAAGLLSPFVDSPSANASFCVRAARALARMDGYREPATRLLSAFADGTDLSVSARIQAARDLAGVDGYRAEGADRLIAFANDAGLSVSARIQAARDLAGVDGYRAEGADRLIAFANDAGLSVSARVSAAGELGRVGDRSRADQILDQLADDPAGRALALSYMSRPARNRRRRY